MTAHVTAAHATPESLFAAPASVTPQEWESYFVPPAVIDGVGVHGLDDMCIALRQAELVIREQEERIRHLEALALNDELTGIANRRGFMAAFERELSLARRDADRGGVLVMIDLDGFKAINDTWGHQAGDAYLQTVSQVLSACVRDSDIVARLGGDEFAIILTGMSERHAAKRIAKIERHLGLHALIWNGRSIPLRASFGCASYAGVFDAQEVIANADTSLYAHKARNRMIGAAATRLS